MRPHGTLAQGRSSGPNPLGPFAAALLVLAIGSGWSAVKTLFAAMLRAPATKSARFARQERT